MLRRHNIASDHEQMFAGKPDLSMSSQEIQLSIRLPPLRNGTTAWACNGINEMYIARQANRRPVRNYRYGACKNTREQHHVSPLFPKSGNATKLAMLVIAAGWRCRLTTSLTSLNRFMGSPTTAALDSDLHDQKRAHPETARPSASNDLTVRFVRRIATP